MHGWIAAPVLLAGVCVLAACATAGGQQAPPSPPRERAVQATAASGADSIDPVHGRPRPVPGRAGFPSAPGAAGSPEADRTRTVDPPDRGRASTPSAPSPWVVQLVPDRLARLAVDLRDPASADACRWLPLHTLLRAEDAALFASAAPGYVLVGSGDGRRVLFSLGELDPAIGAGGAGLVLDCAGAPLQLRVPGDATPIRNLDRVRSVVVVGAP